MGAKEIEKLIEKLGDRMTCKEAILRLVQIGKPAVPALIVALGDRNPVVRLKAVGALGEIARKHPEYDWSSAVPALILALGDENAPVRWNAAGALGEIARKHPKYDWSSAVPALILALGDENSKVRGCAAWALREIGLRDCRDLDLVVSIGGKLKKEGEDFSRIVELHSKWFVILEARATKIIADKSFHVPKFGKPDKTERVLRVRRAV